VAVIEGRTLFAGVAAQGRVGAAGTAYRHMLDAFALVKALLARRADSACGERTGNPDTALHSFVAGHQAGRWQPSG
jgi:hypothetical protein